MSEDSEISIRSATNADCERVQNLVFGVLREYNLAPDYQETDKDLTDIEAYYINRGGMFEILEDAKGNLLGTVGLFPVNAEIVELRKMYFDKSLRGRGYGNLILEKMINEARRRGFKQIYLETNSVLKEAIRLYEKFGFKPTDEKHAARCDQAYFLKIKD